FIVSGHRYATVWPPEAAPLVRQALGGAHIIGPQRTPTPDGPFGFHPLGGAHIIGPQRTLTQDVSFGFDQLVEIAIRALSPAVNDPFTAMTCIDWLGENLCKIVARWHPARVHRDAEGYIRVITA